MFISIVIGLGVIMFEGIIIGLLVYIALTVTDILYHTKK